MKIISFANSPAQPFWSAQIQALAPWISRLKNSLGHTAKLPSTLCRLETLRRPAVAGVPIASNDSSFDSELLLRRHSECQLLPSASKISLRVVRESDSTIQPDCAGRMVISGRMADVCAELDRMVLRNIAASAES